MAREIATKKVNSIPIPILPIEVGVVASWEVVVVAEPSLGVMQHVDFRRCWAREQRVVVHTHQEGCGVENNV